jgi:hypothetical protein
MSNSPINKGGIFPSPPGQVENHIRAVAHAAGAGTMSAFRGCVKFTNKDARHANMSEYFSILSGFPFSILPRSCLNPDPGPSSRQLLRQATSPIIFGGQGLSLFQAPSQRYRATPAQT